MKLADYSPLLIAAILFFCTPALAQEQVKESHPDLLLVKPDRLLADIEPLCVVVTSNDASKKTDLLLKNLKRLVEADLKKAGIAVSDENCLPEAAELQIAVDLMRYENTGRYFMHIRTSLARLVYLEKDGTLSIKTDVWKIGTAMTVASVDNVQTVASREITKQTKVFTGTLLATRQSAKSPDANSTKITKTPVPKSEKSELTYIASKNGKAFHKEGCFAASRIKPENLVTYKSREDALSAGKNPCKQCKP